MGPRGCPQSTHPPRAFCTWQPAVFLSHASASQESLVQRPPGPPDHGAQLVCSHVALPPLGPCPASPPQREGRCPAGHPASFLYPPPTGSAQEAGRGLPQRPTEGLPGAKPEGEKAGRGRITCPRDLELPGRTSRAGDDQTEASPPAGCRPPRPTAPQSPGPCRCLPNLGARRVAPLAPQAGTRWRTS